MADIADDLYAACERFVGWLDRRLLVAGRGDETTELEVEPSGLFWLGRLAPELSVVELGLGDRGERLDPCSVGLRVRPTGGRARFTAVVSAVCWTKQESRWLKSDGIHERVQIDVDLQHFGVRECGKEQLSGALAAAARDRGRSAVVRAELQPSAKGPELTVSVVNTSAWAKDEKRDLNLYQVGLEVHGLETVDYELEALPDSFRYDRRVAAYGLNCGVARIPNGGFQIVDAPAVDQFRPVYWSVSDEPPDMRFTTLAGDPLPSLRALLESLRTWRAATWGTERLDARARQEAWSSEMRAEAARAASAFEAEVERVAAGVSLLEGSDGRELLTAFRLMNDAMGHASRGRFDGWRPFQVGFLLANLAAVVDDGDEADIVDIVWFATGGGKTETYLGLLVLAALYDRLRGKRRGITAWSRFPLRMLSLQQTQRFADAMAGAELARQRASIEGDPFSVGFFVGRDGTPNSIPVEPKESWDVDVENDDMPGQYQVLLRCPFCHEESVSMGFDRRHWKLEHRCGNERCPWVERGLPFYVVDDEIFRILPTVVVGTLDKAALIGFQGAMRGFVAAPLAVCSEPGHGFVYGRRGKRPNGCLVPGCSGTPLPLEDDAGLLPPTFRLQDELHLLRDSLGAVDSHYEAALDALQVAHASRRPKILASSATLAGYEKQVDVLYQRQGRAFPCQGPTATTGFWTSAGDRLARRHVAVAPRGQTVEFSVDRMLTELQRQVRRLDSDEAADVCREAAIDPRYASNLLDIYGTDVVYGNNLRDLEAATRSLETQIPVSPLNTAQLTGRTDFDDVRTTLDRLETPESTHADRIHVVAASSMMSHGVDIDRLNTMVVLGAPLTTAEYIQTSARVGRRWPGLVFLLHKVSRERDAGIYRSFEHFVLQGDRFVEPVPITRRSRRVAERTLAGLEMARVLMVHEPASARSLTTIGPLRDYLRAAGYGEKEETDALVSTLGLGDDLDEGLRHEVERWVEAFFANMTSPAGAARFPRDLCPWGPPMLSLRDVEEQVRITD